MLELLAQIQETLEAGLTALRDPASNPVMALFFLATITLVAIIFLLLVYVVALPGRAPDDESDTEEATTTPRSRRLLSTLVAVFLVALLAAGWQYSVSDRACASCHFTEVARTTLLEGPHAGVPCAGCHVRSGLPGGIVSRIEGAGNAVVNISGDVPPNPVPAQIMGQNCLECHGNVTTEVVVARSIRVRHWDFLDAGLTCTECHSTEAHGTSVVRPRYPQMSDCVACHDDETASASCEVCHSEDVGVAVRRLRRPTAKVNVVKDNCRGCHDMQPCIECHGLELPHSERFVIGYHARPGFLEPQVCMQCHDLDAFCNSDCHSFIPAPAGSASPWVSRHSRFNDFYTWHASSDVGCRCHEANTPLFCDYCHTEDPPEY